MTRALDRDAERRAPPVAATTAGFILLLVAVGLASSAAPDLVKGTADPMDAVAAAGTLACALAGLGLWQGTPRARGLALMISLAGVGLVALLAVLGSGASMDPGESPPLVQDGLVAAALGLAAVVLAAGWSDDRPRVSEGPSPGLDRAGPSRTGRTRSDPLTVDQQRAGSRAGRMQREAARRS